MQGACAGIRVLDTSRREAGSLATMILADYGAEVVRVEHPGTDPIEAMPAYPFLQRGKLSIHLDLTGPEGRAQVLRLLPGFDAVVHDTRPGDPDPLGFNDGRIEAEHPVLVLCGITGFGLTGPYAEVQPADSLVMAKAGVFRDQPGWERDGQRPIYRSCPDGTYFTAMLAVMGTLSALRARDLTGAGQRVDTNMLHSLSCRQNPQVRWLLRQGEELPHDRTGSTRTVSDAINPLAHHRDPREVTLTGMMTECQDGRWIMHSLSEPHFFPAWIDAIGFSWIWDDDRFKGAPTTFPDDDAKVELVTRVQARMKERTAAEWMEAYLPHRHVCADIVQTTQEALVHPQVTATGLVVDVDDPRLGTVRQIGGLVRIPAAPADIRPAPTPGEHTAAVLGADVSPVVAPSPTRDALRGPLDGVTIIEAGYYYALPFATALLAELGARVIKIEPLAGDPYRRLGKGGGDPVSAIGHNNMVRAMQGKESIAIDLKSDMGREILHRLVASADMFIHNFRGRVPDSLGMDADTLRSVNPNLLYHYAASYGSTGPYAGQPAIDPVIAAFAGQTEYQTGAGNPPLRESGADPVAALGHAAAAAIALFAQHRRGGPLDAESFMIVSNIYLNFDDAFAHPGKPGRPPVDPRQFGIGGAHRLYECAHAAEPGALGPHANPDPHWIMLVADDNAAFARLAGAIGRAELAADPRFATVPARLANRAALEAELVPVFLGDTAAGWEKRLRTARVGCVTADERTHFAYLYEDPQAIALGVMTEASHPSLGGAYHRYAPVVSFSSTPSLAPSFCDLGEHTRSILAGAGYTEVAIDSLAADGVVVLGPAPPVAGAPRSSN